MADVIAAADLEQRVPRPASGNDLLRLMRGELQLAAEPNPSRLCPLVPSSVRTLIRCRSNVARPPRTVIINSPGGVVVSHHGSASDLNLAAALLIVSRIFSRSRVEGRACPVA
jgi:hypothetical protein